MNNWLLIKMHHTKLSFIVVFVHLLAVLITCSHGYLVNDGNKKIIFVDSSYYDIMVGMNFSSSSEDHDFGSGETKGCICSRSRRCWCKQFDDATMSHIENDTIIAINNTISLNSTIVFDNFANISIIGYGRLIEISCFNTGESIVFINCNNITIHNIFLNHCGYALSTVSILPGSARIFDNDFRQFFSPGVSFTSCTDITINTCKCNDTLVEIDAVSGYVQLDQVHFFSTNAYSVFTNTPLPTGLIIRQTNKMNVNDVTVAVKITNSSFSQAYATWYSRYVELRILFYILVDNPHSAMQVLVNQTDFSSSSYVPSWAAKNGLVWIRILSCKDAYVEFHKVKFRSNRFGTATYLHQSNDAILHINITANNLVVPQTLSRVLIESCSFHDNIARNIVLIKGDMYLDVRNTSFMNNKADSLLFVVTNFHTPDDGEPLNRFITTAIQVSQSTFLNNTHGHLIFLKGVYILAIILDIQILHNVLLPGYDGLVVFQNFDTLVANLTNIKYEYNTIKGKGSGFHFTSRALTDTPEIRYYQTFPWYLCEYIYFACIPSFFHFNLSLNPDTNMSVTQNADKPSCTTYKSFQSDYQRFYFTNGRFANNIGGAIIHYSISEIIHDNFTNMMSKCIFDSNIGLHSLVYISANGSATVKLTVEDSTFINNVGTVFYIDNQVLQFLTESDATVFDNNQAQNGAALYLTSDSKLNFTNNSAVSFSNNIARRYGGAIYYDITQSSDACYSNLSTFIVNYANTSVKFKNNNAGIAGNSMYFSISQSCNNTIQYDTEASIFDLSDTEIATSPNKLKFYHPAKLSNSTDPSTYSISDIMLGENIIIPGCVLGHDDNPAGSIQFTVQLIEDNGQNISIQGSDLISVDCKTLQGINDLIVIGSPTLNETIRIQLNSFYDSTFDWKPITVNLNVQLSSCHLGFYYSSDVEHCVCYTTDNIVTCSGSNSTIRNGYWLGTVDDQPTVTVCPINYCNFDNCEATTGTCDLHPLRDNQCRAHRSGAACGNCEEGYTLSFDSIECIDIDSCTVGKTVLVITMSFLYWITFTAVVFGIMYFKIGIGYLYGITFYYSIIDSVLENTLLFTNSLYQLVATLSSAAKLLPQFLGQLCFVKGMSGIDQQFIHYLHPLGVLLILALISVSARYSSKLSMFLSRAVIHAICLLLLLSYSSIASTSLLLVRAISFTDVDKVYSYLSPDIEYFHGRHLVYGTIALFVGLVVVIGLPLLLLFEPFVNSKINFIKIKPLLDQFQGCYKDKFRYFASYYMIFRLMILGILEINETNSFISLYSLQIICLIMILIHVTVRPYNNNAVNFFDSFMLIALVLFVTLQIIETYHGLPSNTALAMAFVLVILPLFVFLLIVVYMNIQNIKILIVYCISTIKLCKATRPANNEINGMQSTAQETGNEMVVIIDDNMRRNATVVDV